MNKPLTESASFLVGAATVIVANPRCDFLNPSQRKRKHLNPHCRQQSLVKSVDRRGVDSCVLGGSDEFQDQVCGLAFAKSSSKNVFVPFSAMQMTSLQSKPCPGSRNPGTPKPCTVPHTPKLTLCKPLPYGFPWNSNP